MLPAVISFIRLGGKSWRKGAAHDRTRRKYDIFFSRPNLQVAGICRYNTSPLPSLGLLPVCWVGQRVQRNSLLLLCLLSRPLSARCCQERCRTSQGHHTRVCCTDDPVGTRPLEISGKLSLISFNASNHPMPWQTFRHLPAPASEKRKISHDSGFAKFGSANA